MTRIKFALISQCVVMLCICIATAVPQAAQAQRNPIEKSLRVNVGLDAILYKDVNFSPLNYNAAGFAGNLAYERQSRRGMLLLASLDLSTSTLQADPGPAFDTDRYGVHLELGLLKRITEKDHPTQWYVGGQAHAYLDFVSFDELESISFYGLHSFDLRARLAYSVADRHAFRHDASIPVFGLLVRPPYTGWDKFVVENEDNIPKVLTTGKWTSLNDFQAFRLHTQYE